MEPARIDREKARADDEDPRNRTSSRRRQRRLRARDLNRR